MGEEVDTKADADAENITPQLAQNWKAKIETLTSIQQPQLNGNILSVYYTGENGVQQTQNVDLSGLATNDISIENAEYDAAQNIITITQNDGSSFQINLSEFSIIPTTNPDGSVSLVQEAVEKVKIHKVGISGNYNDLINKPTFAETDTLQSVIDRGNGTTKPIIFQPSQGRAGELYFNPTTYSCYFGNLNASHTGTYNHGWGFNSLAKVTTGTANVAFGAYSGSELTTGNYCVFFGINAGSKSTTGAANTYVGNESGSSGTTSYKNTFVGAYSGFTNTTGIGNTLIGYKAMNTSNLGDFNTAIGWAAGQGVTGRNNMMIGVGAGYNDGAISNKLIIHSNNTLSGVTNTSEGVYGSPQQGQLSRALITGDFLDRWVRMNASYLQVGNPGTNANDITINPSTGITAAQLYTPSSNNDYVQRGWIFANYYNQSQINSLLSRTYRVMGSVANFGALPTSGQTVGDVWNLLDTGENYVWVDNLNNTGIPGWDKLSGIVDVSGYIPITGTEINNPVSGNIQFENGDGPEYESYLYKVNNVDGLQNSLVFFPSSVQLKSSALDDSVASTFDVSTDGILAYSYTSRLSVNQTGLSLRNIDGNDKVKGILISSSTDEPILIEHQAVNPRGLSSGTYFGDNAQDNDYIQKKKAQEMITASRPYKVYTCLLAASGSPALPNPIVLENTIGNIVWSRNNVGEFFGTLNGAFPINKVWTVCSLSQSNGGVGSDKHIISARLDNDRIFFKLTNANDGSAIDLIGQFGSLEIRVYN
ncbi:autotransporter outer membrane beta-barrel domain-containing protein [Chryseobacterium daeguense]|nr:hypothetical protein [Chryseobacterium daeguense]